MQINFINAVTNCLISYMLLNSCMNYLLIMLIFIGQFLFQFTDLFSSCDHKVELS